MKYLNLTKLPNVKKWPELAPSVPSTSKTQPKFISSFMKDTMEKIGPRKELFYLINFDGAKVVQVAGEILEL